MYPACHHLSFKLSIIIWTLESYPFHSYTFLWIAAAFLVLHLFLSILVVIDFLFWNYNPILPLYTLRWTILMWSLWEINNWSFFIIKMFFILSSHWVTYLARILDWKLFSHRNWKNYYNCLNFNIADENSDAHPTPYFLEMICSFCLLCLFEIFCYSWWSGSSQYCIYFSDFIICSKQSWAT